MIEQLNQTKLRGLQETLHELGVTAKAYANAFFQCDDGNRPTFALTTLQCILGFRRLEALTELHQACERNVELRERTWRSAQYN